MVGGGAAAFDCTHDGRPSVLIAGGESKAKFFRNVSKSGGAPNFDLQTSGLELDLSSAPIRSTSTATARSISCCSGSAKST